MPENQNPNELKSIINQTLSMYELAQAERLQWEKQAAERLQANREELDKEKSRSLQQANDQSGIAEGDDARKRLGSLLELSDAVGVSISKLLENAGLAHVLCAPILPEDSLKEGDPALESAVKAFKHVQLAQQDLRLALFRLASASLENGQWESTRRLAKPLLDEVQSPLYLQVRDLVCESHYRCGQALFTGRKWEDAREEWENVRKNQPVYRDTISRIADTYCMPAQILLEKGNLKEAEQLALRAQKLEPNNVGAAHLFEQIEAERSRMVEVRRKEQAELMRANEEQAELMRANEKRDKAKEDARRKEEEKLRKEEERRKSVRREKVIEVFFCCINTSLFLIVLGLLKYWMITIPAIVILWIAIFSAGHLAKLPNSVYASVFFFIYLAIFPILYVWGLFHNWMAILMPTVGILFFAGFVNLILKITKAEQEIRIIVISIILMALLLSLFIWGLSQNWVFACSITALLLISIYRLFIWGGLMYE